MPQVKANGITLEYPVMRHANNLESVLTYEGTSEMHQLTIGKAMNEFYLHAKKRRESSSGRLYFPGVN